MVKFRPRLRQPRFNYNKQLDAEPILYKPEAILKPVTNETKVKLNSLPEEEENVLALEHRIICQMLGYLPITDPEQSAQGGPYVPKAEKERQLKHASEAKRAQLLARWKGNTDPSDRFSKHKEKMLLRHGEILLPFSKPKRKDNPRARELALQIAAGKMNIRNNQCTDEAVKEPPSRAKIREMFKKKMEDKKNKEMLKRVERRKKALNKMITLKKERASAIMETAMAVFSEKENIAKIKEENDKKLKKEIKEEKENIEKQSQLVMNALMTETEKERKKKATLAELKEELKAQVEKKKMFTKLHETGDDELVKNVKIKQGWDEALKKVEGERVDSFGELVKNVKRAEIKSKNRYKKLEAVMARQKQEKHKKMLKKHHALRSRRVSKIATKMNKLQRKGHIVPSFMF